MNEIQAIISFLEPLTSPQQAADAAIMKAIGLTEKQERHCKDWCRMDGRIDLTRDQYILAWAPRYTRSIDDALTLVPDGCYPQISKIEPERWRAHLGFANRTKGQTAESRTPAIAICIAALRARGASSRGGSSPDAATVSANIG